MKSLAPIALFVYARPDHTRITLEALAKNELADASDLYIYCDAARSEGNFERVAAVRDIARKCVGFRTVNVIERAVNFGLAKSITDGVDTLTIKHGRVIVVEDDLVTGPGFIKFMNESLDRYADDQRVMQIAGYNHSGEKDGANDSFFLPITTSWGWATWARAWVKWHQQDGLFEDLSASRALRQKFDLDGAYPYYQMLIDQRAGKNNSWAIRWYLVVFSLGGLTLFPRRSLVQNVGFDGSGEHCGTDQAQAVADVSFRPITFPQEVSVRPSDLADTIENLRRLQPSSIQQLVSRLRKHANGFLKR